MRATQDRGSVGARWGQDLLTDLQGALAQGLRLLVTPTLPVEDSQVVEGGGHLQGARGGSGVGRHSPQPSLLGLRSPRGAPGPVSAPGSAGRRGEGLWPLCTCSGPCGVARGWRGFGQVGVAGATGWAESRRPRDLTTKHGWHPLGVPSGGSPYLPSLAQGPHTPSWLPSLCHPRSLPHSTVVSLAHADSSLPGSQWVASPELCPFSPPPPLVPYAGRAGHQGTPASAQRQVPAPPAPSSRGGCSPHRYTSARMLSMVATSGWQWPELRSRSSKAWRHSGAATS